MEERSWRVPCVLPSERERILGSAEFPPTAVGEGVFPQSWSDMPFDVPRSALHVSRPSAPMRASRIRIPVLRQAAGSFRSCERDDDKSSSQKRKTVNEHHLTRRARCGKNPAEERKMSCTLILVRHCQSDWNAEFRLSGQDNTARLSPQGWDQARALAAKLMTDGLLKEFGRRGIHIVSSDSTRALETASVIAQEFRRPIHVDKRWREVALGSLDGKLRKEIMDMPRGAQLLGELHDVDLGYDNREFGGECSNDVRERQRQAMREAINWKPENTAIIVVGHGSALRTLLHNLVGRKQIFHEQGGFNRVDL